MVTLTIYIAGPMTGLPEYNYPAFHKAHDRLYLAGYNPLSPTDSENENDEEKYSKSNTWYMRRAIRMVTHADGIALLGGWENSKGVMQELEVAKMLDIEVKPIEEWIK